MISKDAVTLVFMAFILAIPFGGAWMLNSAHLKAHLDERSYFWGYLMGIFGLIVPVPALIGNPSLGVILAVFYWTASIYTLMRKRWGMIGLTILTFFPIIFIVNWRYIQNRWVEMGGRAGRGDNKKEGISTVNLLVVIVLVICAVVVVAIFSASLSSMSAPNYQAGFSAPSKDLATISPESTPESKSPPDNSLSSTPVVSEPEPPEMSAEEFKSTEESASRGAVGLYPDLGISGSPFNKAYVAAYRLRRKENPHFFDNPRWPISLAGEMAPQFGKAPPIPGVDYSK